MDNYKQVLTLENEEVLIIIIDKKDVDKRSALNRAIDTIQWAKCDL